MNLNERRWGRSSVTPPEAVSVATGASSVAEAEGVAVSVAAAFVEVAVAVAVEVLRPLGPFPAPGPAFGFLSSAMRR